MGDLPQLPSHITLRTESKTQIASLTRWSSMSPAGSHGSYNPPKRWLQDEESFFCVIAPFSPSCLLGWWPAHASRTPRAQEPGAEECASASVPDPGPQDYLSVPPSWLLPWLLLSPVYSCRRRPSENTNLSLRRQVRREGACALLWNECSQLFFQNISLPSVFP